MNVELILSLIKSKKEGPYCNFKEKHTDSNVDLVHDIICMKTNYNMVLFSFVIFFTFYYIHNKFTLSKYYFLLTSFVKSVNILSERTYDLMC